MQFINRLKLAWRQAVAGWRNVDYEAIVANLDADIVACETDNERLATEVGILRAWMHSPKVTVTLAEEDGKMGSYSVPSDFLKRLPS